MCTIGIEFQLSWSLLSNFAGTAKICCQTFGGNGLLYIFGVCAGLALFDR